MAIAIVTVTAVSAQENGKTDRMVIPAVQTDKQGVYNNSSICCGIKFNIRLSGVTKVEVESVDGNPLAGTASIKKDAQGKPTVNDIENASTIITFSTADKSGFTPGKDYYISTLPCDLCGGYRLSIYCDGLVAHYFGVHQSVEPGIFITPDDLVESELEFDKPGAPLVEEDDLRWIPKRTPFSSNTGGNRRKPTGKHCWSKWAFVMTKWWQERKTSSASWNVRQELTVSWNTCRAS